MKEYRTWQGRFKGFGLRVVIVMLAALWLALIASSWAEAQEPRLGSEIPNGAEPERSSASREINDPDEYDFSWLDPEKQIYVLQNRKYRKAQHVVLSLLAGPGLYNPYRSTLNVEPRIAYYLTEQWGIEAFFTYTTNSSNKTFEALVQTNTNVVPVIREFTGAYGALVHWVPWYAKINVFNSILYFDWSLSGGAGGLSANVTDSHRLGTATTAVTQNYPAFFLGTGHQYHLSRSFMVRLDFMGAFYQAGTYGSTGEKSWYSNWNFGIGAGLKL